MACEVTDCDRPLHGSHYCELHYRRAKRTGDPLGTLRKGPAPIPPAERFWDKVDRSGGPDACWPWTAGRHPVPGRDYGLFYVGGVNVWAHRTAYKLTYGEFPPDKPFALHRCDNPPCCNPGHLFAGTKADNMRDAYAKGRLATNRINGAL